MYDRYNELYLFVMEQFNGSPEEFGELLEEATNRYWEFLPNYHSRREAQARMDCARQRIRCLTGGGELLSLERR